MVDFTASKFVETYLGRSSSPAHPDRALNLVGGCVYKVVSAKKLGLRPSLRGPFLYDLGLNVVFEDEENDGVSNRYRVPRMSFCVDPQSLIKFITPACEIAVCWLPKNAKVTVHYFLDTQQTHSSALHITEFISVSEFLSRHFAQAALGELVKKNECVLKHIFIAQLTPDGCLSILKTSPHAIKYMPPEILTQEMCLVAVRNGAPLSYIPEPLRDQEVCIAAVEHRGLAACSVLSHIPESLKTPELYMAAMKNWGYYALEHVPKEMISLEMCLEAVKHNTGAIKFVPAEMRTYEIYLAAVKRDYYAFLEVPNSFQTPEMCLAAVTGNGCGIKYIPDAKCTMEVRMAAVKQNGMALEVMRSHHKTPEICLIAVRDCGANALKHVPEEMRTPEICIAAIESDFSPESDDDDHRSGAAEARYRSKLLKVANLTPEVCLAFVRKWPLAVNSLPTDKLTPEVCVSAVQQNGLAIKYLVTSQRTPEVCVAAFLQNKVSVRYLTEDQCKHISRALGI